VSEAIRFGPELEEIPFWVDSVKNLPPSGDVLRHIKAANINYACQKTTMSKKLIF
jgi:hypothetical protein